MSRTTPSTSTKKKTSDVVILRVPGPKADRNEITVMYRRHADTCPANGDGECNCEPVEERISLEEYKLRRSGSLTRPSAPLSTRTS